MFRNIYILLLRRERQVAGCIFVKCCFFFRITPIHRNERTLLGMLPAVMTFVRKKNGVAAMVIFYVFFNVLKA